MNPWRNPTDEEYKYIISKRGNANFLCWFLFASAMVMLLFFLFLTVGVIIESLFERDMGRLLGAPFINVLPILGVIFAVRFILKNERSNQKFKDRKISIAYGTIKNKTISHLRYAGRMHFLGIELDDGTRFDQVVLFALYHEVSIKSKILVVREEPFVPKRRADYLLISLPETAEDRERRMQEMDSCE